MPSTSAIKKTSVVSAADKIFIIGLPRTATTSACVALLELGYRVAHTAYSPLCLEYAQVIADTPVFCDYQALDTRFPNAKFIHLGREMSLWIPSIRQLLNRMFINLTRNDGGFNPTLKRCYQKTFTPLTLENIANDDFLIQCYTRHLKSIDNYFLSRPNDLLKIDVSHESSYSSLLNFLSLSANISHEKKTQGFERINIGGKVTAWKKVNHPLKVDSLLKRL